MRLHFAVRQRFVAIRVAFVSRCKVRRRNWWTVWIYTRSENHGVAVRRPFRVVRPRRNRRQLLRIRCRARRRIEIRQPHLLPALAAREKQNPLPIRRELRSAITGLPDGYLDRLAAFLRRRGNRLQPQLRFFLVWDQIYGGDGVRQPLAVRRNGRLAQPLHLHHVLKSHRPLGLSGLLCLRGLRGRRGLRGLRARQRRKDERKRKEQDKRRSPHEMPHRTARIASPREEKVYT